MGNLWKDDPETLANHLESGPLPVPQCLRIALQIAEELSRQEPPRGISLNLSPEKIRISADGSQVSLAPSGKLPEADWAYVAPEQTGRMNRPVDHRAGFYSLGILLYRMLTGTLPFQASDPLEWAHSHIARVPRPPEEINPGIPAMVSRVVMKLLSKDPEDRGQTWRGLLHDLGRCREEWESQGGIPEFQLGEKDIPDQLRFPMRLYGRSREVAKLKAVFAEVADTGRPASAWITGSAGVGKTSLVGELLFSVVVGGGWFAGGKFEQGKVELPFSALTEAFEDLLKQILSGSDKDLSIWRTQLVAALGANTRVIAEVVPGLEAILGKQPPVPELPPLEAQNRFRHAVEGFILALARPGYPLVLFLDDLQWADEGTLAVTTRLLSQAGNGHLLIIGAYRDNEVGAGHPLTKSLEQIRSASAADKTPMLEIHLEPLNEETLSLLSEETLHCGTRDAATTAKLLKSKTDGNPLFLQQYLRTLFQDGVIAFDQGGAASNLDMERIRSTGVTENVAELLVRRISRLEEGVRQTLEIAACAGRRFDSGILAAVSGSLPDQVALHLKSAGDAGFVVPISDGAAGEGRNASPTEGEYRYRWAHDRVQEAALSLIPPERLSSLHHAIGHLLQTRYASQSTGEHLFETVNHLNLGREWIREPAERESLAELNLAAARKAQAATAHAAALEFLAAGLDILGPKGWEARYELAFQLHFHRAESEFVTGNLPGAEEGLLSLYQRARNDVDAATVTALQIYLYTLEGRLEEALVAGIAMLRRFGFQLELHPEAEAVLEDYRKVMDLIGDRRIEDLVRLPAMRNPAMRAAEDLLVTMIPPAIFFEHHLVSRLCSQSVALCLREGNSGAAPLAYAYFGMQVGSVFGDFQMGYRFGQLAMSLMEGHGPSPYQAKATGVFWLMISTWVKPLSLCLDALREAFKQAVEGGDLTYACYICNNLVEIRLIKGDPLEEVYGETEQWLPFVRQTKFRQLEACILTEQRMIRCLQGRTDGPESFSGPDFNQGEFERELEGDPIAAPRYYVMKMTTLCHSGAFHAALRTEDGAAEILKTAVGFPDTSEYHYYAAVTLAASCDGASEELRASFLQKMSAHGEKLRQLSGINPMNFRTMDALVSAEASRVAGRDVEAMGLYETAVQAARDSGFSHKEALACERAARHFLSLGLENPARAYLSRARDCYLRWGAVGKVRQLESGFPAIFPGTGAAAANRAQRAIAGRPGVLETGDIAASLDLLAVVKASQALSGEVVLERLLKTLMGVVMESAGAQSANLLLVEGDSLVSLARAVVEAAAVSVTIALEGSSSEPVSLPSAILNFVRRSRERVVLADATTPHPFSKDEYISRKRPRSVLCLPVVRQSELLGILYLENNLVVGAFTLDRLQALELLASQAAISLDNARLYEAMKREISERQRAEEEVRESREFYQSIIDHASAVIYVKDLEGRYLLVNRKYEELFHLSPGAFVGRTDGDVFPEGEARTFHANDRKVLEVNRPVELEETVTGDGGPRTYISVKTPLRDKLGRPYAVCGISTDITERKLIEEQLRQSQKMEAIGRLAGGVAHDFNNLLTVINGYSSMVIQGMDDTDASREYVREILKAGERASGLTKQLLAYSRKQVLDIRTWDLNTIVGELVPMLKRLIGEDIDLVTDMPYHPSTVKVDRGQVEQIILNLVVNARDAMPSGGRLILGTTRTTLGESYAELHPEVKPGRYVELYVSDTGMGMTPEVLSHIFEPFYSTKEVGKGTGLGLSVVFGIVKQSEGSISVYSELGKGTTFRIYLPEAILELAPDREPVRQENPESLRGSETVLLVEDDEMVREFAVHALAAQGYNVIPSRNGKEALRILEDPSLLIHLIITDVVMPDIGGPDMVKRLRETQINLPVLYISGYPEQAVVHDGIVKKGNAFLQKPFNSHDLLKMVRARLDS